MEGLVTSVFISLDGRIFSVSFVGQANWQSPTPLDITSYGTIGTFGYLAMSLGCPYCTDPTYRNLGRKISICIFLTILKTQKRAARFLFLGADRGHDDGWARRVCWSLFQRTVTWFIDFFTPLSHLIFNKTKRRNQVLLFVKFPRGNGNSARCGERSWKGWIRWLAVDIPA